MAAATLKPDSDFLTPREAARLIRISERHLRELTKSGAVRAVKFSPRTVRYRRTVLLSFGK